MMYPKKYIDTVQEDYQYYQDGLLTKIEWLMKQHSAIQEMLDYERISAIKTIELFNMKVIDNSLVQELTK